MRKLEGLVKEFQDELDYLKRREMRFQSTNGKSRLSLFAPPLSPYIFCSRFAWYDSCGGVFPRRTHTDAFRSPLPLCRIDQQTRAKFRSVHVCGACLSWDVADFPPEEFLPEEVFD